MGLAWFSPDCKHFSKAKGGKPVEKKIRGLAFVKLRWALLVRPRVIALENVEGFVTWCQLIETAPGVFHPDPARKGEMFRGFIAMLTTGIAADHPAFLEENAIASSGNVAACLPPLRVQRCTLSLAASSATLPVPRLMVIPQ